MINGGDMAMMSPVILTSAPRWKQSTCTSNARDPVQWFGYRSGASYRACSSSIAWSSIGPVALSRCVPPATARIAIPMFLALLVWVIFIGVGFKHQGPAYIKNSLFPPGVPGPLYILVAPIEFISTFLVRPFSLTVRLFANLLAATGLSNPAVHVLASLVMALIMALDLATTQQPEQSVYETRGVLVV